MSDLLRGVDTAEFPNELLRVLRELVSFDRALVYAMRRDEAPLMLHDEPGSHDATEKRAAEVYFGGGYRFDPYYREFLAGTDGGLSVGGEELGGSTGWDHVHHVAYLSPVSKAACIVALLTRSPRGRAFCRDDLRQLRSVEAVLTPALRLHWKTWAERQALPAAASDSALRHQVEAALDRFGSCTLTPREGQVVRLLLRGHSTKAAAESLGIAVATTALHRKRAYAKLGVCSQAELFYLFIRSLTTLRTRRVERPAEPSQVVRARPALVQSSWPRAAASGAS